MSQTVLFIKLLLVHYATQAEIHADCAGDVSLQCPGVDFDSINFISVTWYKISNKTKHGIIRRSKADSSIQSYNYTRETMFGEKYSLLLRSVTPEDSGSYECSISANIGGQNQNLKVDLTVHVCATQDHLTTMTSVFNMTESTLPCHKQVDDLPVKWSILGFVAVGLTKIILCLISIWVIRISSSRRRRYKWSY
uniref:Si:dkey-109a10.2 n=1 Tax=Mastacembelus armatus TaxID=205130 RepID=A0A3Q3KWY2_9TELE